MSTPIRMPQLGESVAEGTLGRWLKGVGEWIEKDEPLAEIITDKVNAELPSPVAGRVEALLVAEGDTVQVGAEIARLADGAAATGGAPAPGQPAATSPAASTPAATGAAADAPPAVQPTSGPPAEEAPPEGHVGMFAGTLAALDAPLASAAAAPAVPPAGAPQAEEGERRLRSSPLVRRLAEEHGVDLTQLRGTGLGGRITKDDLLSYLEQRGTPARDIGPGAAAPTAAHPDTAPALGPTAAAPAPPTPSVPPPAPAPSAPPAAAPAARAAAPGEERLPLSPMRRTIAEHLTRVTQSVPQAWTMVEVDVSALVRWREREREAFRQREGVDLTYLAPFVQVVAEALKAAPQMTARWAGDHLARPRGQHLGIAVALDEGLLVPVLRDADERNLVGLARALADLVARARAGTLSLADVQGGIFTINNTGAFGSVISVPIVPEGQTGIITLEAIVKRPVVVDDAIAIRSTTNVCLSFDHRVVDGATAGRFLQDVKRRLEAFPSAG